MENDLKLLLIANPIVAEIVWALVRAYTTLLLICTAEYWISTYFPRYFMRNPKKVDFSTKRRPKADQF